MQYNLPNTGVSGWFYMIIGFAAFLFVGGLKLLRRATGKK